MEGTTTMRRLLPMLPFLLAAWGCSFAEYRRAQIAEQKGDWDEAVIFYLQLVQKQPDDLTYRAALMRAKIKASQAHFEVGKKFAEAGSLERALFEYRQAVELALVIQDVHRRHVGELGGLVRQLSGRGRDGVGPQQVTAGLVHP